MIQKEILSIAGLCLSAVLIGAGIKALTLGNKEDDYATLEAKAKAWERLARAHGALEQLTEECQGMYVTTQMLNAREDVTAAEAALTKLGVKL